jgi:hypothetical protein
MQRTRLFRSIASAVLIVLAGCSFVGEMSDMVSRLSVLQASLQKELPGEEIALNLTTTGEMTVTLVNSTIAALNDEQRGVRTRAIAEFAHAHYSRPEELQTISVVFKAERSAAGFSVSSSQSTDYAVRDLAPLELPASRPDSLITPATLRDPIGSPPAARDTTRRHAKWNDPLP